MSTSVWSAGWPDRLRSIIGTQGENDVFQFVMLRKGESFGKLLGTIRKTAEGDAAKEICLQHLIQTFYLDAHAAGQLREAVCESLARSFCQYMPSGWNTGKKIRERRIDVQSRWEFPSVVTHQNWEFEDWQQFRTQVWSDLEEMNPPADWCPADYQDPLLQQLFEKHWPIS